MVDKNQLWKTMVLPEKIYFNPKKAMNKTEPTYQRYLSDSYLSDPLYKLYMLFFYTRDSMLRARTKDLRRFNVHPRQASVLMAIHTLEEKATPTEISRLIIRDSQTISEILNRMEKDKLINRIKDSTNNKRKIISLTDKGRKAYYLSLNRESIHSIMSCLSIEEQKHLTSCLVKLAEASIKENQELDANHYTNLEEKEQ